MAFVALLGLLAPLLAEVAWAAGEDTGDFSIQLPAGAKWVVLFICVGYFAAVLAFGAFFGRFSKDTHDFFYSGQRFPWWLVTASMIATGIGSYSFLKYSQAGFNNGLGSTMTYLNDWFVMPFFMFGWLPIIYFSRVRSIPEYFERRFNPLARYLAVTIILAYMLFYIGYNLYTIGVAIQGVTGISIWPAVIVSTVIIGFYVSFGGQTAVIFTDLMQGGMLYLSGAVVLVAGLVWLGGLSEFWGWLPVEQRSPMPPLNATPKFSTSNIFWGEGIAGSIAFTFMNQGFIMRYLAVKSVNEGRKAALANVVFLLPLSAVVVGCAGWIGRAMIEKGKATGQVPFELEDTYYTFTTVLWTVMNQNAVFFGVIMATLLAALMSTVDTLINACAAIGVNDLYRPFARNKSEKHYLRTARLVSAVATAIGLLLVWLFSTMREDLFNLHYKGVMVIIPAMVTAIFMGAFWPRYNAIAASVSIIVGSTVNVLTVLRFPSWIDPLSRYVLAHPQSGEAPDYSVFRGLFGVVATAVVGIAVTLVTPRDPAEKTEGLTVFSLPEAMRRFKGGIPNLRRGRSARVNGLRLETTAEADGTVRLPAPVMETLAIEEGDLVYVADGRWWLGGVRSVQAKAGKPSANGNVQLSPESVQRGSLHADRHVVVEKLM
jgi:SSS family solute:Na+ symporter